MYSESAFFSLNEESRNDLFDEPKITQTYWQSLKYDFNVWRNIHNVDSKGDVEAKPLRDPDKLDTSKNVIHGTTLYDDPESSIITRDRECLNFWFNYFANHWYIDVLQFSYKMLVIIACLAVLVGLVERIAHFVGSSPDDYAWRKDSFYDASVPNLSSSIDAALELAGLTNLRKQGRPQWSYLSFLPLINLFGMYLGTLLLYFISCHLGGMSVLVERQLLSMRAWKTWGMMILFSRIFALALMLYYPAQSNQGSSRCENFMGGLELTIFGKIAFLSPALPLFFNILIEVVTSSFIISLPVPSIYYHPSIFIINLLVIRNLIWSCVFKGMSHAMMGSIFPVAIYFMLSSFLSYADRMFTSFHTQRNALLATRVRKNIELFLLSISSDIGKSIQLLSNFSSEETSSTSSDERRILHSLLSAGSLPANLLSEKASVIADRMKLLFQIMNDGLVFDCSAEDLPLTALIQNCAKLTLKRTKDQDSHEIIAVVKNSAFKQLMLLDYVVCIEYAAVEGLVIHTSNSVLVQFVRTLLDYLCELYDSLLDGPRSPELQHALAKRNSLIAAKRKQSSSTPTNNKRSREDKSKTTTNEQNESNIPPIFTVKISLLNDNQVQFYSALDTKVESFKETYLHFDVSCSLSSAAAASSPCVTFESDSSSGMQLLASLAGMSGGFIQRGNNKVNIPSSSISSDSRDSYSNGSFMTANHQSSSFSAVLGCSCDPQKFVPKTNPNSEYFNREESNRSEKVKANLENTNGAQEEGEVAATYFNSRRLGRGGTHFRAKQAKLHRILSHKLSETMKRADKQVVGPGNKRSGASLSVFVISEDPMFHSFVVNLCKIVKTDTALTVADQVSEVREQLMQLSRTNSLGRCVVFCSSANVCMQLQAEDYRGYLVFAVGSRFNIPKNILPTTLILQMPAISADVEAIVKLLDSNAHQDLLTQPMTVRTDLGRVAISSSVDVLSQIDEDISFVSESKFSRVEVVPDIFALLANSTLLAAVYAYTIIEFPFSIIISISSHVLALIFHYYSKFLIFSLLILGNLWEVFVRIRGETKNPFVAHPSIGGDYVCHNYFLYYYDLFKPLNPGLDRVSYYQSEFKRMAPRKFTDIGPRSDGTAQSWRRLLTNPGDFFKALGGCYRAFCEMRKNIFVEPSSVDVYNGHDANHRCAYRKYGSDMQLGKLFYLPERQSLAFNFFAPTFSVEVEHNFQWSYYFLKTFRDRGAEPLVARAVWTWHSTFILFAPIVWLMISFIPGAFIVSIHCSKDRIHISISIIMALLILLAVSQSWRLEQFPILHNSFIVRFRLLYLVRIVPVLFFAGVWVFSQEIFVYFFSIEIWVWLSSLWSTGLVFKSRFQQEAAFFCSDTDFGQVKDIVIDLLCPSVCFLGGVLMLSKMTGLLPCLFRSFFVACILIMSYFYILFVCKTFLLDVFQVSGIFLFSDEKGKSSWILLRVFFYVLIFVCLATFTNGIISQKWKRSHYQAYRLYHMQSDFLRRCRDISRAEIIPLASKVLEVCNNKIVQLCDAAVRPKLVLNSKVLGSVNQLVMGHLLLRTVVLGYELSERDQSRFFSKGVSLNAERREFYSSQKQSSALRNATNIVILRKKIEYWISTCVAHSSFSNTKFLLQIEPSVSCVRINENALEMSIIAFVMTALDRILLSRQPSREQIVCIRVNQLETFTSAAGGKFTRKNSGVNAPSAPPSRTASLPSFLDTRRLVIEILDTGLPKDILHSADSLPKVFSAGQASSNLHSRSTWRYEADNAASYSRRVKKSSVFHEEPFRLPNMNDMQGQEDLNMYVKGTKSQDRNGELWNISRLDFEFMSMFRRGVTDDFNMSMFGQLHTVELLKEILIQLDKHALFAHVAGSGIDVNYGSHQVFSLPYQQLPIAARISEVEDVYMRILRDESRIDFKQAADSQLLSAKFDSSNHQLLGVVIFPAEESYAYKFKTEMLTHGWRHVAIDLANFVSGNVENVELLLKADCVFVSIKPDTYVSAVNKLILTGMKATLVGVDFAESKHHFTISSDSMNSNARFSSSNATSNITWSNQQQAREKISANDIKFHFTVRAEAVSQQHLDLIVDFTNRKRLKRIFTIPDD
jgi:hypothetical protein